jgi:hypothetical protein
LLICYVLGSSIGRTSPKLPSKPLEEESRPSNPTFSRMDYDTASHVGLQSYQSLPSSSSQTLLPPAPALKSSPPSTITTIGPYPIWSTPTYIQRPFLQSVPQSSELRSTTLTEKTRAASSNQETPPTAKPRSSEAIDSLANSSSTGNPSKEDKRYKSSGKAKGMLFGKEAISPGGQFGTQQRGCVARSRATLTGFWA